MKYLKLSAIAILISLVIFDTLAPPLSAQSSNEQSELTPEKVQYIKDNCVSAQTALQRIQRADLVTRTNRGRSYEYILRLTASLNSRIAFNNLNQPRMVAAASEAKSQFILFYGHYTDYEASINKTLRIKCSEQPENYYNSLTDVRQKRALLTADIEALRTLIDEYDKLVNDLATTVTPSLTNGQPQ